MDTSNTPFEEHESQQQSMCFMNHLETTKSSCSKNVDQAALRDLISAKVVLRSGDRLQNLIATAVIETFNYFMQPVPDSIAFQKKSNLNGPNDVSIPRTVVSGHLDSYFEKRLGRLADLAMFIDSIILRIVSQGNFISYVSQLIRNMRVGKLCVLAWLSAADSPAADLLLGSSFVDRYIRKSSLRNIKWTHGTQCLSQSLDCIMRWSQNWKTQTNRKNLTRKCQHLSPSPEAP